MSVLKVTVDRVFKKYIRVCINKVVVEYPSMEVLDLVTLFTILLCLQMPPNPYLDMWRLR